MCHTGLFWSFFYHHQQQHHHHQITIIIFIVIRLSKENEKWLTFLLVSSVDWGKCAHAHTHIDMYAFEMSHLARTDYVCTMTKIYNSAHAHYNFQWILSVTAQWAVSPKQQMTAKICLCEREIDQDDNFGIRKKTIRNEIDTATTAWATTAAAATASVKFISKFPPVYVVSACLKICFRSVIISFFPPVAHAFFAKERLCKTSKCTHTNSL